MTKERACADEAVHLEFESMLDDILDIRDILRAVRRLAAIDSYFAIVTLMDGADAVAEELIRGLSNKVQEVAQ